MPFAAPVSGIRDNHSRGSVGEFLRQEDAGAGLEIGIVELDSSDLLAREIGHTLRRQHLRLVTLEAGPAS